MDNCTCKFEFCIADVALLSVAPTLGQRFNH